MPTTSDTIHSLISPSYLHLITQCPKSLASDALAIDEENEAASRGTLQHAALCMKLSAYFHKECEQVDVSSLTDEEKSEVESVYDYFISSYIKFTKKCSDPIVLIEEKLDLDDFLPSPSWGYIDFGFVTDRTIYCFDAKFGHLQVQIRDDKNNPNPQLLSYCGGIYYMHKDDRNPKKVFLGIAQPKLNWYPTLKLSVPKMLKVFREVITPAASKAFNHEGEFHVNPECCYCRNRIHCRHYNAYKMAEISLLDKPENLTDEDICFLLEKIPSIKKYCDLIMNYAITKASNTDYHWDGFDLSTTRPSRVYTDEQAVRDIAVNNNIHGLIVSSVVTPAAAEKLLGKAKYNELIAPLVTYKEGKPTLVPSATNQKAKTSAKADFTHKGN